MGGPIVRVLVYCLLAGIAGTFVGAYQLVKGHIYSVAAQHEATTIGRVVGMYYGKGGSAYHYVFTVNGVQFDDASKNCTTPLAPRACDNKGPVLVYYAYQPFSNSLLEDFSVAGDRAHRFGKFALAISLPILVLAGATIVILVRKDKRREDYDPNADRNTPDDVPDDLHIAPRE
ncbi:MAG: hypothetical protein WBA18_20795 [Terracidiphilus sp.]